MTTALDEITQATAALRVVARVDRSTLSDVDLLALLDAEEVAGRYLDTSRVLSAVEVADRSRFELGAAGLSMRYGERKPINFVEQITRVSQSEASRRIRLGTVIRQRRSLLGAGVPPERPILAEAMMNGLVGVDAAHVIHFSLKQAATGAEATPERLDGAELALVTAATTDSADLVAGAGRLWRDAMDPDGIEPRYEQIRERRMITIGREHNGIKKYTINADPQTSAVLDAVLLDSRDKKVGPRFLSDEDQARTTTVMEDMDGELVETIVDPRSVGQKNLDVLVGALTAGLRATREGPTTLRTVGSVTAIISLTDLRSGTGFGILEGVDEVIPASVIQELVCETGFFPMVAGMNGLPLYHGPLVRHFNRAQRRAMITRDGDRCIVPGCQCRAASTDAHHVVYYSLGGSTDIDNGVLLCPTHHHALHQGAFEIRMIDGMPYYRNAVNRQDNGAWKPVNRNRLQLASA